jgi:hypothetical protein
MHQIVEDVLGVALVAGGIRSPTPAMPAITGGLVVLNAAVTKGPAGAFRLIGRRLHRVVDLAILAVFLVAVVQPFVDVDGPTRLFVAVIGLVLAVVWWQSSFAEPVRRRPRITAEDGRSSEIGRLVGRAVGDGVNAVRRRRAP